MSAWERLLILVMLGAAIFCGGRPAVTVRVSDAAPRLHAGREKDSAPSAQERRSASDGRVTRDAAAGRVRAAVYPGGNDDVPTLAARRAGELIAITRTIRAQLTLYSLQHRDRPPTLLQLDDDWSVLTHPTDQSGRIVTSDPATFGPYLTALPRNPFNGSARVSAFGEATVQHGWSYDERTGRLCPVVPRGMREAFAACPEVEEVGGIELSDVSK